ncbi:conjugal transfer protein [Ectothiorhodospira shaposhnikovii]|uniref:integrative conjugative element protein, RAQPRD family n=1 Tax=Ectothiorhodospira shaposhnikovii TaxID=1054 RepID=UPI0019072EAD|nr:RAQPRD family integrative conjugative element protein [Ectothiorhodospira shaposhnikovii]MBK1674803.1 conjugal transfer protein [Ectothiorhodospira shaposhnikovii]
MRFTPFLIILSLALPAQAGASSSDAERAHLARLAAELAALAPLIDEAEHHANPDARIRFQYDWLRQDLERVQQGIREHLQAPRAEPRQVPPLRGDYRR